MLLLSREIRVECVVTARSPSGMSVQPDIPIFVTMPSPSRDDGFLEGLDESH